MNLVLQLMYANGLQVRSYSGRGMFGKECAGFVTDNALVDLLELALSCETEEDKDEFRNNTRSIRTDSMGLSTIVYFPKVPFEKE